MFQHLTRGWSTVLTFESLITHNRRTSILLIAGLTILVTATAAGLTAGYSVYQTGDFTAEGLYFGAKIGAAATIFGALVSYYGGNFILASMHGAITVGRHNDLMLFNVVEEMAIAAGIPAPKIFAIKDESPNAFASGRDPQHAMIGITTGLRKKLTREELQAVIAHEMAHIKNYDTRLMMLVAIFAGIVVLMSDFFRKRFVDAFTFKFRGRSRSGGRRQVGLLRGLACGLVALLFSWLAPFCARLLQLAVSREREYLADATAVQFCRNPEALIKALEKIATDPEQLYDDNRATEHMYIVNPNPRFRLQHANSDSLWSTHPPLIKRIQRLKKLSGHYSSLDVQPHEEAVSPAF